MICLLIYKDSRHYTINIQFGERLEWFGLWDSELMYAVDFSKNPLKRGAVNLMSTLGMTF